MLIGLGGGAASSMASGASAPRTSTSPRCSAPTPRCSAAARRSSTAAGRWARPTRSCSSTTSAPAGSPTRCPSWSRRRIAAGASSFALVPNADPGMSPMEIWCNEAQERYVLAVAAIELERLRGDLRARALPLCRGRPAERRITSRSPTALSATRPSTCRCSCCSASRRRCPRRRAAPAAEPLRCRRASTSRGAAIACCAADGGRQEFPDHHRRSHHHRPGGARPDGRPLAGAGGGLRGDLTDYDGRHRRGDGHRRAHAAGAARRPCRRAHGGG
jgi:hypothetical protein